MNLNPSAAMAAPPPQSQSQSLLPMAMATDIAQKVRQLALEVSKARWLVAEELEFILTHYTPEIGAAIGLPLSQEARKFPTDGDFSIFSSLEITILKAKDDDVQWTGRKYAKPSAGAKRSPREDYHNMKINGIERISVARVRGDDNKNFHRRVYRKKDNSACPYFVIHYREYIDASTEDSSKKAITSSGLTEAAFMNHHQVGNSHQYEESNAISEISQMPPGAFYDPLRDDIDDQLMEDLVMWSDLASMSSPTEGHLATAMDIQVINHNPTSHVDERYQTNHQLDPTSQLNYASNRFTSPTLSCSSLNVVDFAPCEGPSSGGIKMLVCFVEDTSLHFRSSNSSSDGSVLTYFVAFGTSPTQAERIAPGVLRCFSPPFTAVSGESVVEGASSQAHIGGSTVPLQVLCANNAGVVSVGMPTSSHFTFIDHHKLAVGNSSLDSNSIHAVPAIEIRNHASHTLGTHGQQQQQSNRSQPANKTNRRKAGGSFDDAAATAGVAVGTSSSGVGSLEREHKIRIVEKLTNITGTFDGPSSAVQGLFSSHAYPHNHTHALLPQPLSSTEAVQPFVSDEDDGGWMDDKEISALSSEDFESLMESYVTQVVNQLVQLASLDQDLQSELDAIDTATGFSLLHYCCQYNVSSLVDILLQKGVSVNLRTAVGGRTALHLAAAAGLRDIVSTLVRYGADLLAVDADGKTPMDCALEANHATVARYLVDVASATGTNTGTQTENHTLSYFSTKTASSTSPAHDSNRTGSNEAMSFNDGGHQALHRGSSNASNNSNTSTHTLFAPSTSVSHGFSGDASHLHRDFASDFDTTFSSPQQPMQPPILTSSNLSSMLLQEAFLSLSLADKCALSLSMKSVHDAQLLQQQLEEIQATAGSASVGPISTEPSGGFSSLIATLSNSNSNNNNSNSNSNNNIQLLMDLSALNDSNESTGLDLEIQSVISEIDKESLDVAMSMMGDSERLQVEEEVKKIQCNVRSWILRKNYINLRESARVLQGFWREKRRGSLMSSGPISNPIAAGMNRILMSSGDGGIRSSSSSGGGGIGSGVGGDIAPRLTLASSSIAPNIADMLGIGMDALPDNMAGFSSLQGTLDGTEESQKQAYAAATLQAATRGMIARKSFARIRRQAMASLVIQKTMVNWWIAKADT